MAENHTAELIGTIALFLFGITMIVQGHFIYHGKYGYRHIDREKNKMSTARKQVEDLFKSK